MRRCNVANSSLEMEMRARVCGIVAGRLSSPSSVNETVRSFANPASTPDSRLTSDRLILSLTTLSLCAVWRSICISQLRLAGSCRANVR